MASAGVSERGRGLDRVLAFSDGVFAIAITLLVLNFRVPHLSGRDLDHRLFDALIHEGGLLVGFVISFFVIARYWIAHHRLSLLLREVDSRFIALNLVFLASVVFLPFPTEIVGVYGQSSTAVVFYAAALCLTAALAGASWEYAFRYGLVRPDTRPDLRRSALLRLAVPLAVFGASIPLAFLDPTVAKTSWLLLLGQHWVGRPGDRAHSPSGRRTNRAQ